MTIFRSFMTALLLIGATPLAQASAQQADTAPKGIEDMSDEQIFIANAVMECVADQPVAQSCADVVAYLMSEPGHALTWSRAQNGDLDLRMDEEIDGVDWAATVEFAGRACKYGEYGRCSALMQFLIADDIDDGVKPELVNHIARACHEGVWYACGVVGVAYSGGAVVPQDRPRGLEYTQMACDHDDPLGCYYLGLFYDYGYSGLAATDAGKIASAALQKGCDLDLNIACTSVGVLLRDGKGVPQDAEAARGYFRKGCDLGDGAACDLAEGG